MVKVIDSTARIFPVLPFKTVALLTADYEKVFVYIRMLA